MKLKLPPPILYKSGTEGVIWGILLNAYLDESAS